MIPLGILAAAGGAVAAADSYDLLATEILTSSSSSITFASLGTYAPDYQHLQLRMVGRTNRASTSDYINVQLNGDTGSNYAHHSLYGNGSSVVAGTALTSDSKMGFNRFSGASASSNIFGSIVLDLLDAFETTKYKTLRSLGGTAAVSINLNSGLWMDTDALTSIKIEPGSGSSLITGSRFSLYGIRKAA